MGGKAGAGLGPALLELASRLHARNDLAGRNEAELAKVVDSTANRVGSTAFNLIAVAKVEAELAIIDLFHFSTFPSWLLTVNIIYGRR